MICNFTLIASKDSVAYLFTLADLRWKSLIARQTKFPVDSAEDPDLGLQWHKAILWPYRMTRADRALKQSAICSHQNATYHNAACANAVCWRFKALPRDDQGMRHRGMKKQAR